MRDQIGAMLNGLFALMQARRRMTNGYGNAGACQMFDHLECTVLFRCQCDDRHIVQWTVSVSQCLDALSRDG